MKKRTPESTVVVGASGAGEGCTSIGGARPALKTQVGGDTTRVFILAAHLADDERFASNPLRCVDSTDIRKWKLRMSQRQMSYPYVRDFFASKTSWQQRSDADTIGSHDQRE